MTATNAAVGTISLSTSSRFPASFCRLIAEPGDISARVAEAPH